MLRKLLAWAQRNERHLGGIVFVAGFITDIVTFVFLDISLVNLVFAAYLAIAASAVFLGHALASTAPARPSVLRRTLLVVLPLLAQYLIGNLLSGFLIFYTKSAVLLASWPFLLLLALVFIGNEWFRRYKDRIAFISVLLYFTAYAYAIFALPLLLRSLGPVVFLGSTALALAAFGIYLALLWRVGSARLLPSLRPMLAGVACVTTLVVGAYFTGAIPPIPLTLKDEGVAHSIRREAGDYVLAVEPERPWFDPRPSVVHAVPGAPVYAYSAVFAPIRFSASVVHEWQYKDAESGKWVTRSRVPFAIAGGREEGYRGYSQIANPTPGAWRVLVKTPSNQVIGQIRFDVERTETPPVVYDEIR